jgi:dimethylhistidine N-methyltransferase
MIVTEFNPNLACDFTEEFQNAVLTGFTRPHKQISPKFLYDQKGSELFDRICDCREYYVTRTETSILEQNSAEIAQALGPEPVVFEFGSGASRKTRILLNEVRDLAAYVPIDISRDFLLQTAQALQSDYPSLKIIPMCADFTLPMRMPEESLPLEHGCNTAFFPGSTIGNFDRTEARAFLERTASFLGLGGKLLIGVDLIKDKAILEPAYDDEEGITAAFNLNLLVRMRDELGSSVNPENFRHKAFFNEREGRIEMHLESLRDQTIEVSGRSIHFHQGETIHTECSYKYEPRQFETMAQLAGFKVQKSWMDPRQLFAVYLFEVEHVTGTLEHAA